MKERLKALWAAKGPKQSIESLPRELQELGRLRESRRRVEPQ